VFIIETFLHPVWNTDIEMFTHVTDRIRVWTHGTIIDFAIGFEDFVRLESATNNLGFR